MMSFAQVCWTHADDTNTLHISSTDKNKYFDLEFGDLHLMELKVHPGDTNSIQSDFAAKHFQQTSQKTQNRSSLSSRLPLTAEKHPAYREVMWIHQKQFSQTCFVFQTNFK